MPLRLHCDTGTGVAVQAEPEALPFATASVDLVLLPHVLEFAPRPHQVLREVERVLVPEGSVIISGFNPYSMWGVRRLAARSSGAFPWRGQYLSVSRLKDWLALLGFETQAARFGCYAPAARQQKWLDRCRFLDRGGVRWWPVLGGVYMLHGIKRVSGMRLIAPSWRERRQAARALAPVAQYESKNREPRAAAKEIVNG
jgi:SAM-dependent methyltransferase